MKIISKKLYNRDLSWLRFNHRVLQEAADKRNPLYERIKFLAIFSSNLDEFFRVRVSDIRKIKNLDKKLRKQLITKPTKLLDEIKNEVHKQQEKFGEIYREQIIPELKDEGIMLLNVLEFDDNHKIFAEAFYKNKLADLIQIKTTSGAEKFEKDFIENEALYLVSLGKNSNLITVKIPSDFDRFILLPKHNDQFSITFIDDILKYNLSKLYKSEFYTIKVSRDAELYIDNEYSGNLLNKIKNSLGKREIGQVTRILIDSNMPDILLKVLKNQLDVNETDVIYGSTHHNFKDFFSFPNPTKNKHFNAKVVAQIKNKDMRAFKSLFDVIDEKDRLLYYPYESFEEVLRLINEAAMDDQVSKIKITLYRVSTSSNIAKALIKAAQNDKEVFVFIETKARFDEINNMKWGKMLEEAGATVFYSYPGIKVHSKILYIERIVHKKKKSYAYISTGNFNEKTAKIYTDFGLMTSNSAITSEVLQVFKVIEGVIIIPKLKKLLVSPFNTRKVLKKLIKREIKNASLNKEAYIILKLNSLQDEEMISLLYRANNSGVKIRLIVRGICCLVPGIVGQSENIYITSIVDGFLEHGRVYIFANGGQERMYIGSADWMTRNLDHRIEVVVPILDNNIFTKIRAIIQLQLDDTVKSRIIDAKQTNLYVNQIQDQNESSQQLTYKTILNMN